MAKVTREGDDATTHDCQSSMDFAIKNTRLSGGEVSEETRALMSAWVRKDIDDDELMEAVMKRRCGSA